LAVHVDDLLLATKFNLHARNITKSLHKWFEVKDLGEASRFMVYRTRPNRELQEFTLDQEPYILEVMSRFNIDQEAETPGVHGLHTTGEDSKEPSGKGCRYRAAVRALLWIFIMTRPDVSDSVRAVARCFIDPARDAVQRIMQYLLATSDRGITDGGDGASCDMFAYADSDYAEDTDTRCSVSGGVVMLGKGAVYQISLHPSGGQAEED
ncbi:unnamed protein product, partial [Discosporangium mesarthrocarpum]